MYKSVVAGLAGLLLSASALAADKASAPKSSDKAPGKATPVAAAASAARPAEPPFATVGDVVLSRADYRTALAVGMRKKYYHAKPPEGEEARFQREVGEELVNRVLLEKEARRRGVLPDQAKIKATIDGYDKQYKNSPNWAANRDKMLANVVPQLERESVMERFEKLVKTVDEPSEAVARAYYNQHKDLFVEPEQVKLAVILLKVDPSSPHSAWDGAHAEGKRLHQRLLGGADFAELAKLHSGDKSGADGGEMEYTHRGMLPTTVHEVVDKLKVGEISAPVQLLEGVAILKLVGRKPATQRAFEQVKDRAGDLWQREEGETRWKKLIADLRRATPVTIDQSVYAPLPASSEKKAGGG